MEKPSPGRKIQMMQWYRVCPYIHDISTGCLRVLHKVAAWMCIPGIVIAVIHIFYWGISHCVPEIIEWASYILYNQLLACYSPLPFTTGVSSKKTRVPGCCTSKWHRMENPGNGFGTFKFRDPPPTPRVHPLMFLTKKMVPPKFPGTCSTIFHFFGWDFIVGFYPQKTSPDRDPKCRAIWGRWRSVRIGSPTRPKKWIQCCMPATCRWAARQGRQGVHLGWWTLLACW